MSDLLTFINDTSYDDISGDDAIEFRNLLIIIYLILKFIVCVF